MTPNINWDVPPDPYDIEQLSEMAKLPLWAKIDWLEEAQLIVESLHAAYQERQKNTQPND